MHAYVCDFGQDAQRWWELEWEYGRACVLTLCLYVGVWPVQLAVMI